jgi:S-DNA-T family DNA segregation ATPase FtsK/SpoIIIE
MVTDLAKMPHLLIAGATGTGKSVAINSLFVSLLYRNTPQEVKFIVIDPKRVELILYNGIPHLLTPVVIDHEKAVNALKWAVAEMDRRYKLLAEANKRNIVEYNSAFELKLPYIIILVDELADLMAVAQGDVEAAIVRLAQMARAVGVHLVVATQRPSVDIITGLIKANITSRMAFAVASQVDSRTILDMAGAEKLLGNGDMLFVTAEFNKPKRIQGAFIGEKEVKFWKSQKNPCPCLVLKTAKAGKKIHCSRKPWRKSNVQARLAPRCCSEGSGLVTPGQRDFWTFWKSAALLVLEKELSQGKFMG